MSERGVIATFKAERRFGFIRPAKGCCGDADSVFFHLDDCGQYLPANGDPVEFEVGYSRDGRLRAREVRSALAAAIET